MYKSIFVLIIILLFITSCQYFNSSNQELNNLSKDTSRKRVLVVHSYHDDYSWTRSIDDGIDEGFKNEKLIIRKIYMDTKRNSDPQYMKQKGKEVLDKINDFKPNVVITSDDNAQKYVAKYLRHRKDVAVVFCGVNAKPEKYGFPTENITGIIERPKIMKSIELLHKINPNIKTYSIISDNSNTGAALLHYLKVNFPKLSFDKIIMTNSFTEWKSAINENKSEAILISVYHTLKDENGKNMKPKSVMEWTINQLKIPTIGFYEFAVTDGVLAGYLESGYQHGLLSTKMAIEILNGEKPNKISITTTKKGEIMVNNETAKKLNLNLTNIKDN